MRVALNVLCGLIALEHLGFLVLEMFLWKQPFGLKTFGMTQDVADSSAVLAGNQGLYNGFLAAGLVWGLVAPAPLDLQIKLFFLSCVAVAGVYGGITAKISILVVQALPAVVGLGLLWLTRE